MKLSKKLKGFRNPLPIIILSAAGGSDLVQRPRAHTRTAQAAEMPHACYKCPLLCWAGKKPTGAVCYNKWSQGLCLAQCREDGVGGGGQTHGAGSCMHSSRLPPTLGNPGQKRAQGPSRRKSHWSFWCLQRGTEVTVQINSETERRMWDASDLPSIQSFCRRFTTELH